jgi:hypothetical protein
MVNLNPKPSKRMTIVRSYIIFLEKFNEDGNPTYRIYSKH